MRAPSIPILLLALVVPLAQGGTEVAPDVDDLPDQEDPRLDLLAAWFRNEPGGVRFTVKLAMIEANSTDLFYAVGFDMAGASRLAAVETDASGALLTYLGPEGPGRNGEPPEAIANGALDRPDVRPGSPGYATAIIPFEPGTTLQNLSAGVSQYQRTRARWADVDFRQTDRAFTAERTIVPSAIGTRVLLVAAILLVFVAGASGGAWYATRRARRGFAQRSPDAPSPSAPAGEKRRFGLSPKR